MAESDLSNEASATTVLPAPTIGDPSVDSNGNVVVPWTVEDDSSDGGIDVERRLASGIRTETINGKEVTVQYDQHGRWVCVQNYEHYGGTNPSSQVGPQSTFPQLPNGVSDEQDVEGLGTNGELRHVDKLTQYGTWDVDAVRLEAVTTNHSRKIHFFSTNQAVIDAVVQTQQSSETTYTDYQGSTTTLYGDHTADLPESAGSANADTRSDRIFGAGFPFYNSGTNHWAVAGMGNRWEVDDYPADVGSGYQHSTVHRVWVRIPNTWTDVATGLSPSTTSHTDTTVSEGTTYQYRVERNTDHATATSGSASGRVPKDLSRSSSGTFRQFNGSSSRSLLATRSSGASFSQFEGSGSRTATFSRSASGTFGTVEGSVTRTITFTRASAGTFGPFDGSSTRDGVAFSRSSGGQFGTFEGSVTGGFVFYRTSSGTFGQFDGDSERGYSAIRSSTGTFGPFNGESSRGKTALRSSEGTFGSLEGLVTRMILFERASTGTFGVVEGEATRVASVSRTSSGEFKVFEGSSTRSASYVLTAGGEFGRVVGTATRSKTSPRSSSGDFLSFEGRGLRTAQFTRGVTGTFGAFNADSSRAKTSERASSGTFLEFSGETSRVLIYNRTSTGEFGVFEGQVTRTIPNWVIDGRQVRDQIGERRNWQELTLAFRAPETLVESAFRPLDGSAGEYDIVERPDGSYAAISRAGQATEVTVEAPDNRQPLRSTQDWVVEEYNEEYTGQSADIYNVELTLVAQEPKASVDHGSASADADQWLFEFADGSVATSRIDRDVARGGSSVKGKKSFSTVMSLDEADIVEDSLNRQAAARIREVPDAQNLALDENAAGRNTVTVTVPPDRDPDEKILQSGDYVVVNWETELINDEFAQVSLELLPKS